MMNLPPKKMHQKSDKIYKRHKNPRMKEGIKMQRKWIAFMMLSLFLVACTDLMTLAQREKTYGTAVPVIKESFAAKEMSPLGNWKIYLNAEDPDGDMRYIRATISHPGMGAYPVTYIPIAKENAKELSGYIYWNSLGSTNSGWLNYLDLTAEVWIQDRAGHTSKPVTYTVSLQEHAKQAKPPAGMFKENDLGPINIQLFPQGGEEDLEPGD
jgi:hypothetical protein